MIREKVNEVDLRFGECAGHRKQPGVRGFGSGATVFALHIIHNVETLLPNSPEMGRPGRVPGTRELVIPRTP
jgi:hypothetical protein